jgi:hypothetical protein
MGGVDVLPESSCSCCRDLTSKFEGIVARDMFGDLRIKENYPSRRKERRPTELPAKYFNADGEPRLAKLLVSKYPLHYPTVTFPESPGFLTGIPEAPGHPELQISGQFDPTAVEAAIHEMGANSMSLAMKIHPGAYCQTLAKTAHALICAIHGMKGWQPLLPPLIRLDETSFGHYIGSDPDSPEAPDSAATVTWKVVGDDHALVVRIQHLGRLKIPRCQIVAGVITDQGTFFAEGSKRGHSEFMKRMWAAEQVRAAGLWPEGTPIVVAGKIDLGVR